MKMTNEQMKTKKKKMMDMFLKLSNGEYEFQSKDPFDGNVHYNIYAQLNDDKSDRELEIESRNFTDGSCNSYNLEKLNVNYQNFDEFFDYMMGLLEDLYLFNLLESGKMKVKYGIDGVNINYPEDKNDMLKCEIEEMYDENLYSSLDDMLCGASGTHIQYVNAAVDKMLEQFNLPLNIMSDGDVSLSMNKYSMPNMSLSIEYKKHSNKLNLIFKKGNNLVVEVKDNELRLKNMAVWNMDMQLSGSTLKVCVEQVYKNICLMISK